MLSSRFLCVLLAVATGSVNAAAKGIIKTCSG
jgi:hypothetical protein